MGISLSVLELVDVEESLRRLALWIRLEGKRRSTCHAVVDHLENEINVKS